MDTVILGSFANPCTNTMNASFAYRAFRYFWREKGDPERHVEWGQIRKILSKTNPELINAWKDYKRTKALLNKLTEGYEDSESEYDEEAP